ncbi:MAG: TetR family transcriptional regulator [Chloroflexi bacterium]|nr:TetR family transcriptional regulator [Ktedonobacteraceae bacterium]MBV9019744.1 TetR family transcriptional regulator [Ktedonobacteraceae bacterium]MBV9708087.1 TetR family transcriptional regulator [Chloroflexota bacterium]
MTEAQLDKGKTSGKARLLEAARTLAQGRSFDEITIDEIVKVATLSKPAFYYHFPGGKEELRSELTRCGYLEDTPTPDTRESMLEAALRVFARSGVSAATMEDIAAEAGVSRGALCWHFHSKDDLLNALVEHTSPSYTPVREEIDQIEQELLNGVSLDDKTILLRLVGAFYDAFTSDSDLARLPVLLLHTHPEVAHLLANRIVKGRKKITEYVRKRQEEGSFRADIDASFFIQTIVTPFAMRALCHELYNFLPFAQFSREQAIEQLVELLLYGMMPREQLESVET